MSIVGGIVVQNLFDFHIIIILCICTLSLVLFLYKKIFLYVAIIALSMMNTLLHKPIQFDHGGRAMVFVGNVIGEDQRANYTKLKINIEHIVVNDKVVGFAMPVEFYTRETETLLGQRICINGVVRGSKRSHKPNILVGNIIDVEEKPMFLGRIIYAIRHYITGVLRNMFGTGQRELALGLILGGSGRIKCDFRDILSRAGILHILAVSGLHVGFVCVFAGVLLFFVPISTRLKFIIIMLILGLYAGITGFRPSVCRATIMAFLFGLGLILQRNVDRVHIANIVALVFLIFEPSLLFDVGAQLSFAAVYGIFVIYPVLKNKIIDRMLIKTHRMILMPIAVSFSAQVFVAPLLIYYFHRLPTLALVTNFLIVPLASVCIFLLFFILLASTFSLFCVHCLAFFVSCLFALLTSIARFFADLPFSTLALSISPVFLPFCYLLFPHKTRRWAIYCIICMAFFFSIAGFTDCMVIRAAPFGALVTTNQSSVFVTIKCSSVNTARFLSQHNITDLDYLIAPRFYYPVKERFFKYGDVLHIQRITLGQMLIRIGQNLEIEYRDRQVYSQNYEDGSKATTQDVQYVITDGDKAFSFSAPSDCSILERMIIDLKTAALKIATLF